MTGEGRKKEKERKTDEKDRKGEERLKKEVRKK